MVSRTVIIEPSPTPDNNGRSRAGRCGWHDGGFRQLPEATTLGHIHSLRSPADPSRSRGAARPFDAARRRPVLSIGADGFAHLAGPGELAHLLPSDLLPLDCSPSPKNARTLWMRRPRIERASG